MNKTKGVLPYITPGMEVLEMETEDAIMAESDNWFEQGGEGDFNYNLGFDDDWA